MAFIVRATLFVLAFIVQCSAFSQPSHGGQKLKATLIVGPLESRTKTAIAEMDEIAELLLKNGIAVERFYHKKAKWSAILKSASESDFFIYSGHGSNMGVKGRAGGLCLSDREMISTSRIMSELKLKPNSMVIMKSVCNAAGSSAGDPRDIGINTAKNRVEHYAYPFLELGAAVYYADNYLDGAYTFLELFLAGESVINCYRHTATRVTHIEFESEFPRNQDLVFSISSSGGAHEVERSNQQTQGRYVQQHVPPKSYDIALVGLGTFSMSFMK